MYATRLGSLSLATLLAAVLFVSAPVQADTVPLNIYSNQTGESLDGLNLLVDVTQSGNTVLFKIQNESAIQSSITRIYFGEALTSYLSNGTLVDTEGQVLLLAPARAVHTLQGSDDVGFNVGSVSFGADRPSAHNGINEGESATIAFDLAQGKSLSNVLDDLAHSEGALGVRVNRLLFGENAGYAVSAFSGGGVAAPVPAALLGGLLLLGGLASHRLRKHA